jgi:hypothetical protein
MTTTINSGKASSGTDADATAEAAACTPGNTCSIIFCAFHCYFCFIFFLFVPAPNTT